MDEQPAEPVSDRPPLEAIERTLQRVLRDLDEVGAKYALIGGLAVGLRTEMRFTKDIDFAIAVSDDQNAESVVFSLQNRGYRTLTVMENKQSGRLSTVRLRPPRTLPSRIVDLLFSSCGIENEVVETAQTEDFVDCRVPVARPGHLIAMKLISQNVDNRPTDRADILNLIEHATPAQFDETRRLAQLVIDRGYHRDRDLLGDLDYFIRIARERRESGEVFF